MNTDPDSSDDAEVRDDADENGDPDRRTGADTLQTSFPPCPRCGDLVVRTVVKGPLSGSVRPCGCRVLPGALGSERE